MIPPTSYFMMRFTLLCLLVLLTSWSTLRGDIPLKLESFEGSNPNVVETAEGVVEIHGPASLKAIPKTEIKTGKWVLEMEIFSVGEVNNIRLIPGPPFEENKARPLPDIAHSDAWSSYTASIDPQEQSKVVEWQELRIDLPISKSGVLQIKNAHLRPERLGEFDPKSSSSSPNAANTAILENYLKQVFDEKISNISVETSTITIRGKISGDPTGLFLAEIPMEFILGAPRAYESLTPLPIAAEGNYTINLPRFASQTGHNCDRLTTRWQIFRKIKNELSPISHSRYADEVVCRNPALPPAKVNSKKGLGGWSPQRLPDGSDELADLGISAITVNIFSLHQFVSLTPAPGTTPFDWQGRTYYAREEAFAKYDSTFREAEKHGVMVSAILLIDNTVKSSSPEAKLLGHPDTVKEGQYSMPNVTSTEGIAYYGAILNLITERWSHNQGPHGRVHHWIVHNEVDFGWVWTNAGVKSDVTYMDLYQRSMRLIHLIARQYDPNTRAFITLTHHWAQPGSKDGYGSKRLIELLLSFCRTEGDFPWALAYHPYPQSLFNPRTWEDQQATFDFNTPKITPKNLEVLDAYMKLSTLRFRGEIRPVHLSENGFNSKDYSPTSLEDQAAGMALAWKKMDRLSSIKSWQYHNWIDNRREGGLKIGLRKFPDDPKDPFGKKPIWFLYQALGTEKENKVADPYLKTIGISSWDEVLHYGVIH